ncbi:hypothetical protein VTH82DRAFT_6382 [Thermothelomyces myriococcoides]
MCSYTTHVRVCACCAQEDTVLISEQLCQTAKASGIFGSCLEGVLCQRDATGHRCWQCKETATIAIAAAVVGTGVAIAGGRLAGERKWRVARRVERMGAGAVAGGVPTRPGPVDFSKKWV